MRATRVIQWLAWASAVVATAGLAQMLPELVLPGTPPLAKPADPAHFTFVVVGETAPASADAPPTATLERLVGRLREIKPAFVMFLGDTVFGHQGENRARLGAQYDAFLRVVDRAGVTAFNAPGDREMLDSGGLPNSHQQLWYGQFMKLPFGAFDYGNSRFIVLNTEEVAAAGPSPGATLGAAQRTALRNELGKDQGRGHVFLFMHRPMKPARPADGLDAATTKELEQLFRGARNLSFVVASHEAIFFNPQDPKNEGSIAPRTDPSDLPPTYLVTGGGGLAAAGQDGAFPHALKFSIDGNRVEATIIRLEAPQP